MRTQIFALRIVFFFCNSSLRVKFYNDFYFRKLRNARTRIHLNLFLAILIQDIVRFIIYTDQAINRDVFSGVENKVTNLNQGIESYVSILYN